MTTAKTVSLPKLTPKIIGGFIGSGVISLVAANFVPIFISGLTEDLGVPGQDVGDTRGGSLT